MTNEKVECPYCGQEFEDKNSEGVHRSKEHVTDDENKTKPKSRSKNLVEDWKRDD